MKRPFACPFFVRQGGGAAVEFALVLPILLTLLFGILEYGWYFTQQIVLINAVQQGARTASRMMREDDQSMEKYESSIRSVAIETVSKNYWFGSLVNVDAKPEYDDKLGIPEAIVVWVSDQPFKPLTGYLPDAMVPSRMGARSKMVLP